MLVHAHTEKRVQRLPERVELRVRPIDELDAAPWFEARDVEFHHTVTGHCADACALVDSERACPGVRPIGDDDDGEGKGVDGSDMQPSLDMVTCEGLSALCDEERANAVSGDYTETTECVRDEPDDAARVTSGVYYLRSGGDVGLL